MGLHSVDAMDKSKVDKWVSMKGKMKDLWKGNMMGFE